MEKDERQGFMLVCMSRRGHRAGIWGKKDLSRIFRDWKMLVDMPHSIWEKKGTFYS